MRINSIRLKNYRQHRNLELSFLKKGKSDLHIFIGLNGIGKTNLLNAINWCLYGDEPHLSNESQQYPLLNSKTWRTSDSNQTQEVLVEISLETDDRTPITLTRQKQFRISADSKSQPTSISETFEVAITTDRNNRKFKMGEEAQNYVDQLLPKNIREYFLFDGERLDNYFKDVTGKKIQNAIIGISQIDLLISLENRLRTVSNFYRSEVSKSNPDLEKIRGKLEEEKTRKENLKAQYEGAKEQKAETQRVLSDLQEKLEGIPSIEDLEKERAHQKGRKADIERLTERKIREKESYLFDSYIKGVLRRPVITVRGIIREKIDNGEIPVVEDKDLIEDIAHKQFCKICGRPLDTESQQWVADLLKQYKMSSIISNELVKMQVPLSQFLDSIEQYPKKMAEYSVELDHWEEGLRDATEKITKIDTDLETYDGVKSLQRQRFQYEAANETLARRLGTLEEQIRLNDEKIAKLTVEFEKEGRKHEKLLKSMNFLEFCDKAVDVVQNSKGQIIDEIRQKIEIETNQAFFSLIWKKETFGKITIDENFNVKLLDIDGIPMLGSTGKAESELLALAFTLGLHNVSGFEAPIVIDTPVARISGVQRVAFGTILTKISESKQILLLFTPDEYTENIREIIEPEACNKITFKMAPDEKETTVEVV